MISSLDMFYICDRVSCFIDDDISAEIDEIIRNKNTDDFSLFRYLVACMNQYFEEDNDVISYLDENGKVLTSSININSKEDTLNQFYAGVEENTIENNESVELPQVIYGFNKMDYFFENLYEKKVKAYINISKNDNRYVIDLFYDCGFWNEDEAQAFLNNHKEIIESIICNQRISLEEITFKNSYYDSYKQYEVSKNTIIDLFKDSVNKYPNKCSLYDHINSFSYIELDKVSNRLAQYLKKNYTFKTRRIGIYMDRSADNVVCILAILKLGCSYIPINTKFPEEKIKYILQSCDPDFVICDKNSILEINETYCFDYDDFSNEDDSFDQECCYDDLAYIIYTSGTTGQSKGVMISHYNVVNMMSHFKDDLGIRQGDIVGQFASFSFDASVSEMFMALFTGATLFIIDDKTISDFSEFEKCLKTQKVSVLTLPPSYSRYIDFSLLDSLRLLLTAGSDCEEELYRNISKYTSVINAYGPTECTVCATTWHGDMNSFLYHNVPIGKSIPNVRVYIINRFGTFQPFFIPGEICIGGNSVGKGYLNNKSLSDDRFVSDPLFPDEKMYRTGDFGRLLPNGNIEFLGRRDDQVKVNGIRIELSEITERVLLLDDISDAYTMLDRNNKSKICLYYVSDNSEFSPNEVREKLSEVLPQYMIPNHIQKVDNILLNSSGKPDKNQFDSKLDLAEEDNSVVDCRNDKYEFEEIFEDVLGIKNINIKKDLFCNGGSSIDMIKIITELHNMYDVNISVSDFYSNSSLAEIYDLVKRRIDE